jgi:hypothetical protein
MTVKLPKFDGSTSWTVFHSQFKAAADHNSCAALEKALYLPLYGGKLLSSHTQCPARAAYEEQGAQGPLERPPVGSSLNSKPEHR